MKKVAFNAQDTAVIKQYLAGGALVGGGTAAIMHVLNYLNGMGEDEASDPMTTSDVLDLRDPTKVASQQPEVPSTSPSPFRLGLGLTGGVMAAGAAYQLVKNVTEELTKRKLIKEIEEAQQNHSLAIQQEAELVNTDARKQPHFKPKQTGAELDFSKLASALPPEVAPAGLAEKALAAPTAGALLMALAAAAVTNKALQKSFPKLKAPGEQEAFIPRHIRLKYDEPAGEEGEDIAALKQASCVSKAEEHDALEFLVDAVHHHTTKTASSRDLDVILGTVATGGATALVADLLPHGVSAALDRRAGKTLQGCGPLRKLAAVGVAARNAALKPTVELLAAAEFTEVAPFHVKLAAGMPAAMQDTLVKLAASLRRCARHDVAAEVLTKFANATTESELDAIDPDVQRLLERALTPTSEGSAMDDNAAPSTIENPSSNDSNKGTNAEVPELQNDKDIIDALMNGDEKDRQMLAV